MKKYLISILFLVLPGLSKPAISQTNGIISDAVIIPPDYHTFAGPAAAGQTYVDPVFGTVVMRMTDSGIWANNGNGGEIPNSEISYFNIDDTYFMVSEQVRHEGTVKTANVLYDGHTGVFVKILGFDGLRPWWCRWAVANRYKKNGQYLQFDPARHFYKYEGNEVRLYSVQDLSYVTLHQFTEYNEIGPAGGEGDLSLDGRYWLLDGDGKELFVYDLIDDIKLPTSNFDLGSLGSQGSNLGVDYATVSASGNYNLVSWSYEAAEIRYRGLELYDKNWNFLRQLHPEVGHWVRGIDASGAEVVYCVAGFGVKEFWQRQGVEPGDYVSIRLTDGYIRQLIDMPSWARHLSCAVSLQNNPDYVYVAFRVRSDDPEQLWQPYWGEIVEVPTNGSRQVRRLVHHRTRKIAGQSQKFDQPDFNVNHAGTTIIYRSAYTNNYCDLYMFHFTPRNGEITIDNIPPNAPANLSSSYQTTNAIKLNWDAPEAAADGDLASSYQIVRDDSLITKVYQTNYLDENLAENRSFTYEIYSLDRAGNRSIHPATGTFSTAGDSIAPVLARVQAVNATKILVDFSEPVDRTGAETVANYLINQGISIINARLLINETTVELITSPMRPGLTYELSVSGIKDQATTGNEIAPYTRISFQLSPGFFDNFENGLADNWLPWHNDRWEIREDDGDYSLFLGLQPYDSPGGQRLGEYAIVNIDQFIGNEFDFSCKAKSGEDLQHNKHADYAFVFGYRDTLNYYYVQFHTYDAMICQVKNGQRNVLVKKEYVVTLDKYSNIRIGVKNDSIAVYVNEKMVLFSELMGYDNGTVGLGSYNDSVFFDDVVLSFLIKRDSIAPEPPEGIKINIH